MPRRSRAAVSNLLRLLNLNNDVRALVETGQLDMGHARALLSLEGADQSQAAKEVVARGLSVREAESLVKNWAQKHAKSGTSSKPSVDADTADLQRQLSEHLGAKVLLSHSKGGKGKIVIQYNSLDELDGILQKIR